MVILLQYLPTLSTVETSYVLYVAKTARRSYNVAQYHFDLSFMMMDRMAAAERSTRYHLNSVKDIYQDIKDDNYPLAVARLDGIVNRYRNSERERQTNIREREEFPSNPEEWGQAISRRKYFEPRQPNQGNKRRRSRSRSRSRSRGRSNNKAAPRQQQQSKKQQSKQEEPAPKRSRFSSTRPQQNRSRYMAPPKSQEDLRKRSDKSVAQQQGPSTKSSDLGPLTKEEVDLICHVRGHRRMADAN